MAEFGEGNVDPFALFNSSDSDSDFEGFEPGDIQPIGPVLSSLYMGEFSPSFDKDIDEDLVDGWKRLQLADDSEDNYLGVPVIAPFTGDNRLNVQMDNDDPIDFFKIFFTDDFIDLLVVQTNLYAEQTISTSAMKENSRMRKWRPVTVDEMKIFLALILVMGVVQKQDIDLYWSTNEVICTPFFGKNMSRDRFLLILSNLHLVDNTSPDAIKRDPLFKVRPFVNLLMTNFNEAYSPERNLSFDEAMCPWKGRLRFRVYNPAKPQKFGIKLYQVCEATSGYCLGFDVYTGGPSCSDYCESLDIDPDCTQTTKTVIGLLARCGLLDKGHHIYMDNYYSSPELFNELELLGTYSCGTLRSNRRGVPVAIQRKRPKLKSGEIVARRKENLLCIRYHDKRDVVMLSNIHDAQVNILSKVDRKTKLPTLKPACVYEYCKSMGGVDLSDQLNSYYSVLRKTVKWYKKLFLHLLSLSVINSFILYTKFSSVDRKKKHLDFVLAVASSLCSEAEGNVRPAHRGRKCIQDIPEKLTGRHFPAHIPALPGAKRKHPARDCVVCNVSKRKRLQNNNFKRKQSSFWCPQCERAMCVPDCFLAFHTLKNYRTGVNDSDSSDSDSD